MSNLTLKRPAHETIKALKAELSKALPVSEDLLDRLVYALLCRNDGIVLLGGFGESLTISFLNWALAKLFKYGSGNAIYGDKWLTLDQFLSGVEPLAPNAQGTSIQPVEMHNFCAITNITGAPLRSVDQILEVVQPGIRLRKELQSAVLLPEPFFLILHEQSGDFSLLPDYVKYRAEVKLHLPELCLSVLASGTRCIEPVMNIYELVTFRHYLDNAIHFADDASATYAVHAVQAVCEEANVEFSTRALHSVIRLARVEAAANGRLDVFIEDVDKIAAAALSHRTGIDQAGVTKVLESVVAA